MGLASGDADGIIRIARALTLQDLETSERVPWDPFPEQIELWRAQCEHQYVLAVKPRKRGFSTATILRAVLWLNAAAAGGNRVRAVTATSTDTKAKELADQAEDFACRQMQLSGVKPNEHGLTFPGGSAYHFMTLGGADPGRGGTIHFLHVTELPFARDPEGGYQALRSACAKAAPVDVETTMDPADDFPPALWRGARRDRDSGEVVPVGAEFGTLNHGRFLWTVEADLAARLPANLITDAEWERARAEDGFTIRDAAAWWLKHCIPNLCAGNRTRAMHDYPQCEKHLFAAGDGRVINVDPPVAEVLYRVDVHGVGGDTWQLDVYIKPEDASGQFLVTVDTSQAVGASRSVVAVTDIVSGKLCAASFSNKMREDDLARVAQMARAHFTLKTSDIVRKLRPPHVIIEDNGIGGATCNQAERIGLPHERWHQDEEKREACITEAKRAIEDGHIAGPPELVEECQKLRRKGAKGYDGPKDIIMAIGIAQARRKQTGFVDERWKRERKSLDRVYVEERMAEERKRWRGAGYGRRV